MISDRPTRRHTPRSRTRPIQPLHRQCRWHRRRLVVPRPHQISPAASTSSGFGSAAWSADGESLALLSALPLIGHHDVSTAIDVCTASGSRHVTDIPNAVSGIAWTDSGKTLADTATPNLPSRNLDETSRFYAALGFSESWRDKGWMILNPPDSELTSRKRTDSLFPNPCSLQRFPHSLFPQIPPPRRR
jgi:hypothetical protein